MNLSYSCFAQRNRSDPIEVKMSFFLFKLMLFAIFPGLVTLEEGKLCSADRFIFLSLVNQNFLKNPSLEIE